MCWCTPAIRTPFCGKPGCAAPAPGTQAPPGRADALQVLSGASGLSREDLAGIWAEVKANQALLESCRRHDFSLPSRFSGKMVTQWRCAVCSGTVDGHARRWYMDGLEHAGRAEV